MTAATLLAAGALVLLIGCAARRDRRTFDPREAAVVLVLGLALLVGGGLAALP